MPAPRNGGYAILIGFAVAVMVSPGVWGGRIGVILAGAAVIAVKGAVDDWWNLRELYKLLVQILAAAVLVFGAGLVVAQIALAGWSFQLGPLAMIFTLVWVVGYTNAFNFMDGINGIAATHAIVVGAALTLMFLERGDVSGAVVAVAIAGAAAGFLPWNLPSGSIFMGDVGSATLGFLLAALVARYVAITDGNFIRAILPMMPFILDTAVTLVRRIGKKERFLSAHRSHFYQRLNQLGWSHASVTGLWTAMAVASAVPAVLWMELSDAGRVWVVVAVVLMHGAAFFFIHEREISRL